MNPYWEAFRRLTGGGPTWEFMAWIGRAWRAFDATGHGLEGRRRQEGFAAWLAAQQSDPV